MSRNYNRQKTAVTGKAAKGRRSKAKSPSPDLSSGDEGYSALEDLGDSDDADEENVDAAEVEHIIGGESQNPRYRHDSSPRPLLDDEDDDDDGDDEDEGDGDEEEDDDDDEDEDVGGAVIDDSSSWNGIESDNGEALALADEHALEFAAMHRQASQPQPQPVRHVRFANVPDSSDSDSTDTDDDHADMFPDIFVDQSTLDPAIRREIDRDLDDESEGSGGYWDFQGVYDYSTADSDPEAHAMRESDEDTPTATPIVAQALAMLPEVSMPLEALDESLELDGYETDGDTTEEDIPEPSPAPRKKTRRPEVDDEESDSDKTPIKSHKGHPRVGRFNLDKSGKKPIAVLDPITRKMLIFTPHKHRQLDLSPEQFNFTMFSQMTQTSPMGTNMSTLVMDTMFSSNTFADFMNGQELELGNVDALLGPSLLDGALAAEDSFDSDLMMEADEGEKHLDISDFIRSEWSDTEGEETDARPDGTDGTDRPDTAVSDTELLPQLSSANVGAFRQNQINQQLMLSTHATQDSIALSAPYNDTTLRGLKADRMATAGISLSPLRRRKSSSAHPPTSPIESLVQKRKASSEHEMAHKRHRSISDMATLRV